MRRKKGEGLIAPIVAETRRPVLLVEGVDRQQLDSADAEVAQIGNLVDQPGIGAALGQRHLGAGMPGKAANMQLVDDRLGERPPQRCITLPVISSWVGNDALERRCDIVAWTTRGIPAATRRPGNALPVGIE